MELRYIVIGLSILAIVGILGDLWLRRKKALREPLVKDNPPAIDPTLSDEPIDDFPFAELPSGGARVRQVTPEEILALDTKFKFKTRVPILMDSVEDLPLPEATTEPDAGTDNLQQSLDFDQELPEQSSHFYTDPFASMADTGDEPAVDSDSDTRDGLDDTFSFSALSDDEQLSVSDDADTDVTDHTTEDAAVASDATEMPEIAAGARYRERRQSRVVAPEPSVLDEPDSPLMDPSNLASPEDSDWEWDEPAEAALKASSNTADRLMAIDDIASPTLRDKSDNGDSDDGTPESIDLFASPPPGQDLLEPDEVIVINVVADMGLIFAGDQLLEIALACGMRFGAMDIFHRTDTTGRLQFSMASCTKPGTFDIDAISETTVSGVSLFMTLPCSSDAMQSFEYMSETANVLARHLKGVMKDESHNVMRGQTIEHCRNRIREYARAQMLNH